MNEAYGRDFDLNLLRVLVAVADAGSVTRAASTLYLTQPAVSAALRRLSSFVGAPLFVRQGRGLVLTSRGDALVAVARAHLGPLVAAVTREPTFDARTSTAMVRIGLSDSTEGWLLPPLLTRLRVEASSLQLCVLPVQFRSVEDALLSGKVDLAVTVADALPPSILRRTLLSGGFVCLHDPRFSKLPKTMRERDYFAHEHVVVSYAGDMRGVVEDALGKARKVRVSVGSFAYVADLVEGTPLLGTVPALIAEHMRRTHPRLRTRPLPLPLASAPIELLWSKVKDEDGPSRFLRELVTAVASKAAAGMLRSSRA